MHATGSITGKKGSSGTGSSAFTFLNPNSARFQISQTSWASSKTGFIAGPGMGNTASCSTIAEDTLSFSRFQTFNFAGWGDAPQVLEPLLFYVLHRASNEITDPAKLGTFKAFPDR